MVEHWVNRYIGIPYADKGRTIQGCDCWGLVYLVLLEQWGIRVPTYTEDYTNTNKTYSGEIESLIHHERKMWIEISQGQEQPGDVINLRMFGKDWHTGIVTEPGEMLHTLAGHEAVLETYLGIKWNHRISGFFRHEQLTG